MTVYILCANDVPLSVYYFASAAIEAKVSSDTKNNRDILRGLKGVLYTIKIRQVQG